MPIPSRRDCIEAQEALAHFPYPTSGDLRSLAVAVPEAAMTKILLIGAGQAGKGLLEMFQQDPSITILGVVDIKAEAPGLLLARRLRIPTGGDFKEFIRNSEIDLIID